MTIEPRRIPACPDCSRPLEVLKSCGASSYFCNHCNELKGSARVREANPSLFSDAASGAGDPAGLNDSKEQH
ncbi:zinc ribbon domain-containing protein [Chitiniphilus purpureus]|uniref:Zinc ribbon domain-containing protein n=1 Tax=Chitiniphilus purpureus TaxID=2981137 RepID=A0ABY6DS14_9NEIS|nr:zinc ribbon domain-containing protein [Chitiniphilus sp. CD1]UXY17159.1 zinc ribbon domain-containing protein [Chitiniphilus sp. CD1]